MSGRDRTSRSALVRYALMWAVAGGIAVLLGLAVTRLTDAPSPRRAQDPIATVARSGCVLTRPQREHSRPPVSGPPALPATVGAHDSAPSRTRLVGALRHGFVVVQYEPGISASSVDVLGRLTQGMPRQLVLTPDRTGMPFVVAATAWHRLLGCSRIDARVIDALRTFASRYAGQGPDAG